MLREALDYVFEHPLGFSFLWIAILSIVNSFTRGFARGLNDQNRPRRKRPRADFGWSTKTTTIKHLTTVYLCAELDDDLRVTRVALFTCKPADLTRLGDRMTMTAIIWVEDETFEKCEAQLRIAYPLISPPLAAVFPCPGVTTKA